MTVRFTLQPPAPSVLAAAAMKPGGNQFAVKAVATSAGKTYTQGYQVVEYPHTTRRHVLTDPQVAVKALDVKRQAEPVGRLRDGRRRRSARGARAARREAVDDHQPTSSPGAISVATT